MKKLDMSKIIGITGEMGSGKTYTADKLGILTGFEVIHVDKYFEQLRLPGFLKQFYKYIKLKSRDSRNVQQFDVEPSTALGTSSVYKQSADIEQNKCSPCNNAWLSKAIIHAKLPIMNHLLKKDLRKLNGAPAIVEFVGLGNLHAVQNFAECNLIQSAQKLRYQRISKRDNTTLRTAQQNDMLWRSISDNSKIKLNHTFINNSESLPNGLEQYAEELIERFG